MNFDSQSKDEYPQHEPAQYMRKRHLPDAANLELEPDRGSDGFSGNGPTFPVDVIQDVRAKLEQINSLALPANTPPQANGRANNEALLASQRRAQEFQRRADEQLELLRRAVAASESALEEERQRTQEAKEEAVAERMARKSAEVYSGSAIFVAIVSAAIAIMQLLKDLF